MGGAENSSDMASKEQTWAVLVEVLDLLQSRAKVGTDPKFHKGVGNVGSGLGTYPIPRPSPITKRYWKHLKDGWEPEGDWMSST